MPDAMTDPIVAAHGISFAYAERTILHDVSLAVAYRLLRSALVEEVREAAGEEVDREAYRRVVADVRLAISKLDSVRSQHQAAINSINRAGTAMNDVIDAVLKGLRQLDELMGS